jgi:Mrp family chromosome partitioning ATPase
MTSLAAKLAEHADFVLFDTPSAVAFTDAVVLSRVLDGVILVVRAHQVPRSAELQVRNLLVKAKANILGVVLNDVQPEMVDSYYYHSHYYPDEGYGSARPALTGSGRPSLPVTK